MEKEWTKVAGFSKYEMKKDGTIRHIVSHKVNGQADRDSYIQVSLMPDEGGVKACRVAKLVLQTFNPTTNDKLTVSHIDKNYKNNNLENLKWVTATERNNARVFNKEKEDPSNMISVWRINPETKERLEFYKNVKLAADWVLDNNLSRTQNKEILKGNIYSSIKSKNKAYTFNWEYGESIQKVYDDEIWKPIDPKWVDGAENYQISNYGRSKNPNNLISDGTVDSGYISLWILKTRKRAHQLVALAFIENPENKPSVNHIDGDKKNNHVSNLEWVTASENTKHAHDSGLINSKKTIVQYDLNGNKIREFESIKAASIALNIGSGDICSCCLGNLTTIGGFKFKYKENENEPFISIPLKEFANHKVIQYDLDNNFIAEFENLTVAAKETGCKRPKIQKNCHGQQKTVDNKYIFKFVE